MLITALDHLALAVPDVGAAAAEYALVLGSPAVAAAGAARLQCDNVGLVLEAGAAADGARAGVPLRLMFAAPDLPATRHRLARRGLVGEMQADVLRLDRTATHGVEIGVVTAAARAATAANDSDIAGLDHVVVRTQNSERAVALYGGRLGLDLRLDRLRPEIGVRQMFFVLGGLVVEVVQSLKEEAVKAQPDTVWGLAWRSRDIEASRARLVAAGVDVSDVRDGRKAGTRVATVKTHVSGVPTLLIGGEGLERG